MILLWEQHPNPDRYQRSEFEKFFEGAMQSKGAFKCICIEEDKIIGSSRYYEFREDTSSICIGYSFIGRNYWGKNYNREMKKLMLNHAFQFVDQVFFHVGANNIRSQMAMRKIGGEKIGELMKSYYGEPPKLNFEYVISKDNFIL